MTYLKEAKNRVRAMVKDAFANNGITSIDVAFWPYVGEGYPYATVRWTGTTKDNQYGQDFDNRVIPIEIMLLVAPVDSGQWSSDINEHINNLSDYTVWIEDHFAKTPRLTSTEFPDKPQYFNPLQMELTNDNGDEILRNSGTNTDSIGTRFVLTMQYIRSNY